MNIPLILQIRLNEIDTHARGAEKSCNPVQSQLADTIVSRVLIELVSTPVGLEEIFFDKEVFSLTILFHHS